MPYIVISVCYPPSKIDETVKVFLEVQKKYPPEEQTLLNIVIQSAIRSTKDGLEALTVYEVDKNKVGDALVQVSKRMLEFRNIEGYLYNISTWLTIEEALSTLEA